MSEEKKFEVTRLTSIAQFASWGMQVKEAIDELQKEIEELKGAKKAPVKKATNTKEVK